MTTTHTGRVAESSAADFLRKKGYKIIAKNWRTRRCEIDLIVSKENVIYFTEVKYRKSDIWGSGTDAIINRKQNQMKFAADLWTQTNGWAGDYRLLVISLSGEPPQVDNFIEL